jgi:NADPH:quinone reductase-like Zn-dependent oxidoreductase
MIFSPGTWKSRISVYFTHYHLTERKTPHKRASYTQLNPKGNQSVMKAAIVQGAGQSPVYGEFSEPQPREGECRVSVTAAAMSHVVKSRASGAHYSSTGHFPFVAGIDGTGRLDDGRRVYFVLPSAPHGSMAECTVVATTQCVALPDELDDMTAAAIANPGMSSWAAYTERARLRSGETVLVNGATGTSGRLAVQIARQLGAKKIIATGRNREALKSLAALGADVTIELSADGRALEGAFKEQFATGVDVVIDYLWGQSAERLLIAAAKAGPDAIPIRFVQVGSVSGPEIALPSAVLRSSAIELMGSGIGSIPLDRMVHAIGELLCAAVPGGFRIATTPVPLSEVERAWPEDDSTRRTVFTMG